MTRWKPGWLAEEQPSILRNHFSPLGLSMHDLFVRMRQTLRPAIARRVVVLLLATMTVLPTGCVRRRLLVQSNPAGAMLFVDNQQIGTTPCSVDFTYYGTREIRLVKPGFETLTVNQPIPTPWYEIPPIDFVSENLVPSRLVDHRTVAFNMQPQVIVPTDQLIDRGESIAARNAARDGRACVGGRCAGCAAQRHIYTGINSAFAGRGTNRSASPDSVAANGCANTGADSRNAADTSRPAIGATDRESGAAIERAANWLLDARAVVEGAADEAARFAGDLVDEDAGIFHDGP